MIVMVVRILRNVLRIYLTAWKKPGASWRTLVEHYLLALSPEDMKQLRLGVTGYRWLSRVYKLISGVAYWRMVKNWPYKTIELRTRPRPLDEFTSYAMACIEVIEQEFLAPNQQDELGLLTLDKDRVTGEFGGLGDTMKWHGLYVASLYRLGITPLFEKNLRAMEKICRGHLHRHASYHLTTSNPISTCSISGLAQALLVPKAEDAGGLVGELRASVYAVMKSTDFFIPRMDNTPTIIDLRPNIAANAVKALAYTAIKIMGDDLSNNDICYLCNALDWKSFNPTLDSERSFYGSHTATLLCDAILCARPDLWPVVFPHLAEIPNHDPGVENGEAHAALYYHLLRRASDSSRWENIEHHRELVLKQLSPLIGLEPVKHTQSGVEGCVSADILKQAGIAIPFEHIADTPLPLPQRLLQDYAWQRTPYEFRERCDYTTLCHPRLDFIAPWSRIAAVIHVNQGVGEKTKVCRW